MKLPNKQIRVLKLLNVCVIYMKIISLKGVEVVKVSIFLITYVQA